MAISGAQLKMRYGSVFFKVLKDDMKHYDFTYKLGLNVDFIPFPSELQPRLYFSLQADIFHFWEFGSQIGVIEVPDDARVYIEDFKCRADKIILKKVISKAEFLKSINFLNFIRSYPFILKDADQTLEICLAAVNQDPDALQYAKDQTPEICLAAVKNYGSSLKFVKSQTPEICLAAVNKFGRALEFVKDQSPEICLAAVKQDGFALEFVKHQTPKICLAAVKQDGFALEFVKRQTHEICLAAVKQDGEAIQFVKRQTPEICTAAVKQNEYAIEFIKKDYETSSDDDTSDNETSSDGDSCES